MAEERPTPEAFTEFAKDVEPRLRYALVASWGYHRGREAVQDALVYAWEHWPAIQAATNPAGYLYRIAHRRASQHGSAVPLVADGAVYDPDPPEPGLGPALARLSRQQRAAVLLIEGLGLTYREAAELLGVSRSSVQTHLERGLERLRTDLGVTSDA